MGVQIKSRKAILLVDDEPDIRGPIVGYFKKNMADIMVVEAENGSEASQKINNQEFSCIITDLNMPKANGQDLIKNVKNSRLNRNTPIIVLSAFPDESLYDLYDYLTILEKPIGMADLSNHLKSQLMLGPLDRRISTFVFTNLVAATVAKLKVLGKVQPKAGQTTLHKTGGDLPGWINFAIRINSNNDFNTLVIGFDKEFFKSIEEQDQSETWCKEFAVKLAKKLTADVMIKSKKPSVGKMLLDGFRNISDSEVSKIRPITSVLRVSVEIEYGVGKAFCHGISGSPKL